MPDPLRGAKAKLKRADQHIEDFERELNQILWFANDRNPWTFGEQVDPNGNVQKTIQLRPIPDELSAIAGDAIHNLRSALDHIAFAFAVRSKITKTGSLKKIEFPIKANRKSLNDTLSRGPISKMRPDFQGFFRVLKPYNRGNRYLWLLQSVDIVDKHRKLLVLNAGFANPRIVFGDGRAPVYLSRAITNKKRLTITAASYGYPDGKAEIAPLVAFNHGSFRQTPAPETAKELRAYVGVLVEEAATLLRC